MESHPVTPGLSPKSFHSITCSSMNNSEPNSPNSTSDMFRLLSMDLNNLVESELEKVKEHPNASQHGNGEDIDMSTYVSAKSSTFSTASAQQKMVTPPKWEQLNRLSAPQIPELIRQQLENLSNELKTLSTINLKEKNPKNADLLKSTPRDACTNNNMSIDKSGNKNDINLQSIKQPIGALDSPKESSPDLLYFSDEDFDTLSQTSAWKEQNIVWSSPSSQSPPNGETESLKHIDSKTVDEIVSFFDCSKPKFPPSPSSQTVKKVIRTNEIPTRPVAAVSRDELDDPEKKSIYVIHQTSCTPVSWFSDTSNSDVREMVLCACDAIIDRGFVLREFHEIVSTSPTNKTDAEMLTMTINNQTVTYRKGLRYEFEEFHKLTNGGTYILEPASERTELLQYTGDRWRRLRVAIDPMKHVEALKAIKVMKRGANLLKHTNMGFPHLRQFQLSSDSQRLLWYSAESNEKTIIYIPSIKEIRLGQKSTLFQKYKLPSLEHLSFSIMSNPSEYSSSPLAKGIAKVVPHLGIPIIIQSLDITCKDEIEYDHWVTGLKALVCSNHNIVISKKDLLSHSRRFRKALESSNSGIELTSLPEIKDVESVGLQECLELPLHSFDELEKKSERLNVVQQKSKEKIQKLDLDYDINLAKAIELLGQFESSAALLECTSAETFNQEQHEEERVGNAIFRDRSEAEDDLLEYIRMQELLVSVNDLLETAKLDMTDFKAASFTLPSSSSISVDVLRAASQNSLLLKKINQHLWKAEVDLENVDDMYRRLLCRRTAVNKMELFSRKFAEFNDMINSDLQVVKDQISNAIANFFSINSSPDLSAPIGPTITVDLNRRPPPLA